MHERTKGNYLAKTLAIGRVLFLFQSIKHNVMVKSCTSSKTEYTKYLLKQKHIEDNQHWKKVVLKLRLTKIK